MTATNNREKVMADQEVRFVPSGVHQSEADNVATGRRLAAGPIFLKRGPFRRAKVPPGTVVIITQGSKYERTLREGSLFTLSLPTLFRLEQYVVDVRRRVLELESWGDFHITYCGPRGTETLIPISVTIQIEYEVVNPELIVFVGSVRPITNLDDRAVEATRAVVNATHYDAFLTKGPPAAQILELLQGIRLEESIGLRVTRVLISKIGDNNLVRDIRERELKEIADAARAARVAEEERERERLDAEARREQERLDAEVRREQKRLEDEARREREQLDAEIRAGIARMTGQDVRLLLFGDQPEVLESILAGERKMLEEQARILISMFETNTLASLGLPPFEAAALLQRAFLVQPQHGRADAPPPPSAILEPTPAAPSLDRSRSGRSPMGHPSRLAEDIEELKAYWNVTALPPDADSISLVMVNATSPNDRPITIYLQCMDGYPHDVPVVHVIAERQPLPLDVDTLISWTADHRLLDLVREVLASVDTGDGEAPANVVRFGSPGETWGG